MTTGVLQQQDTPIEHRGFIILTIMMLAILEVLDSTIVNVALPNMMASLGANQNQITWVLTSYVVASAIVLPLTGFLSNHLGRKKLLLTAAIGFMISSFLCGASQSLAEIVFFRVLQGIFGSSLIPLSQAILRSTYPLEQQGKAMTIWALGIMAAPICGPTLGGFITEHASWRWVFYINLPFCLLGIFLVLFFIQNTPVIKQRIDGFGLLLMIVGIACLQIFLDKGNEMDWFNSNFILALIIISAFCLIYFIIRSWFHPHPVVKLKLYLDHNFRISSLLMLSFSGMMFALITLLPMMLENLYHYPTILTGWTMAPLGLASALGMMIAAPLMKKVKVKYILTVSLLVCSYGAYRLANLGPIVNLGTFLIDNAIMGVAMGSFMVPLATYALMTLPKNDVTEASGLFSYARMVGTSVGLSLLSTLVARLTQINWHSMTRYLSPFHHSVWLWLHYQHYQSFNTVAVGRLSTTLATQSLLLAFTDVYRCMSIVFLILLPLVWRLRAVNLTETEK